MTDLTVEVAALDDKDQAIATLGLAFAADPVMRWFWPDALLYREAFPKFVDAIASKSFTQGTSQWLDGGRGVALWMGPGCEADDDRITQVIIESVDVGLLEDLSAFADLIHEHHPVVEHWYLPFTGVDPVAQGRGLGSTLLAHALATCDQQGLLAYLEASTVRSRLLYERFGFRETGAIQVGGSPRVWSMTRDPSRTT
jgi:GNAT superfamily N-acetyltransferase